MKPTWPKALENKYGVRLTAASNGQWSKKHNGKRYNFGVWAKPEAAARDWKERWSGIVDGTDALVSPTGGPAEQLTMDELFNGWLKRQKKRAEVGDLSRATYLVYEGTVRWLLDKTDERGRIFRNRFVVGMNPDDWGDLCMAIREHYSPRIANRTMTLVRQVLAWGKASKKHPEIELGPDWSRVTKAQMRRYDAGQQREHGAVHWTANEIVALLRAPGGNATEETTIRWRAMIWLAVNGGYAQEDIAGLEVQQVNLDERYIDYPREKTAVPRRTPLWPETVAALRLVIGDRKRGLVFRDQRGRPLVRIETSKKGITARNTSIAQELRYLCGRAGVERGRRAFHAFRRTFRDVLDHAPVRKVAVDHLMGHVSEGIAAESYIAKGIPLDELRETVQHVRQWLKAAETPRVAQTA